MFEAILMEVGFRTPANDLKSGIIAWRCNAVWVPTPEQEEDPLEEEKPGYPGSTNIGSEGTVH